MSWDDTTRRVRWPGMPMVELIPRAMCVPRWLTVLHVDKDFDLIAATTGQQVERLQLLDGLLRSPEE